MREYVREKKETDFCGNVWEEYTAYNIYEPDSNIPGF